MATAPKPKGDTIKDDEPYRVMLARSIKVGRGMVHPGENVKLRGDVLKAAMAQDADAVVSFEPYVIKGA
jgi:hypothetical protein